MNQRKLSALLLGMVCGLALSAQTFTPDDLRQLYPAPEQKSILRLRATPEPSTASFPYSILDYSGKIVGKGVLQKKDGKFETEISQKQGFYELDFGKQRVGIAVLSALPGNADPFFALETLYSSYPADELDASLSILKRFGISTIREYHSWALEEKKPGQWNTEREKIYPAAASKGIGVTTFLSRSPLWTGAVNIEKESPDYQPYPKDLRFLKTSIPAMTGRRIPGLTSFQVENETDLQLHPGDCYIPMLAASSWILKDSNLPLLLSAFSSWDTGAATLDPYRKSGMLDYGDIFAFHTYHGPEQMLELVRTYRSMMKGHPKAGMPIWITESGKAWSRGIIPTKKYGPPYGHLRAPVDEDKESALQITMKGIEAKAAGVEKYFPFTAKFFAEGMNNFGMTDFYKTPHRSMLVYLFSARILGGKEYIGDLKQKPEGVHSARVFANSGEAVTVLYTGNSGRRTVRITDIPHSSVFSIAGTAIVPDAKGNLVIDGGICYLTAPAGALAAGLVNPNTEHMKYLKLAKSYKPVPRKKSPVVYQFEHWKIPQKNHCYYIGCPDELEFRLFNLSDRVQKTEPEISFYENGKLIGRKTVPPMELKPGAITPLKLKSIRGKSPHLTVVLRDKAGLGNPLYQQFTIPENGTAKEFELNNAGRWTANSNGKMTISAVPEENAIRFQTVWKNQKGYWVYPEYTVNAGENLSGVLGISFEIKAKQGKGSKNYHHVLVQLSEPANRYKGFRFRPPQEEWESRIVYFSQETDFSKIKRIRIGMGPVDDSLDYSIRNVKLIYP